MRNSASCGTPHHAELHMLFSAKDWKPLQKSVPILRKYAELRIGFPLLAEYWDKFSVTCGTPQYWNICGTPQDVEK